MYPVSEQFRAAVRRPHTAIVKAEVWRGDEKLLELQPLEGSVEVDGRRAVRRTCSVSFYSQRPQRIDTYVTPTYAQLAAAVVDYTALAVAAPTYAAAAFAGGTTTLTVDSGIVPDSAFDALAPFGNELRLWRGIRLDKSVPLNYASLTSYTYTTLATQYATYGSAQSARTIEEDDELVPLGVFEIESVRIVDGQAGIRVDVTGSDRSSLIQKSAWTDVYSIPSGTNVGTAISALLSDRYDEVETKFTQTSFTLPQVVLGADSSSVDPWTDAQSLATASGYQLYFDGEGYAVLEPSLAYDDTYPVATYAENSEAMLLSVTRTLSNSDTFNGVIATGEGTEAGGTIRDDEWDDDPASPTYYLGIFGKRPYFFSSPLILTQTQAVNAASAILATKKGATENIEWTQIVDPSLDAGDLVSVENSGTKVSKVLIIDRLSIPLKSNGTMSAVARTVRSLDDV